MDWLLYSSIEEAVADGCAAYTVEKLDEILTSNGMTKIKVKKEDGTDEGVAYISDTILDIRKIIPSLNDEILIYHKKGDDTAYMFDDSEYCVDSDDLTFDISEVFDYMNTSFMSDITLWDIYCDYFDAIKSHIDSLESMDEIEEAMPTLKKFHSALSQMSDSQSLVCFKNTFSIKQITDNDVTIFEHNDYIIRSAIILDADSIGYSIKLHSLSQEQREFYEQNILKQQ